MSGTLQSIVVFSQYVRFNLVVLPTFNLLGLVFSLLDLLAKLFINDDVEVA